MIARHPWLSVAIAIFGVAWGANQFAPMLRFYTTTVGLSEATVSATFGIYGVGVAPGILLGGPLSDRYGRPAVLIPAIGISVLATLAFLGADTALPLYIGRLLAGIAFGLAFSAGRGCRGSEYRRPNPRIRPGPAGHGNYGGPRSEPINDPLSATPRHHGGRLTARIVAA